MFAPTRVLVTAAIVASIALPAPAHAQDAAPGESAFDQQVKVCGGQTGGAHPVAADAKIAACTALLSGDRLSVSGRASVYVWRSLGYGSKGDKKSEMSDLDAAVAADPTSADAWAQSCSAHTWDKQTARAIRECTTAIRLAPKAASPWTYRGDIYLTQHDYKRAISDYDHALTLDAKWMWPWDNRGEAYLRSGNIPHAIADFDQVIKVSPDYAMGYLDRGIARIKSRAYAAALADFEQALKVQPKSPSALYGRGIVKLRTGDRTGGNADIAAAKKLSPDVAKMFEEDGVNIKG